MKNVIIGALAGAAIAYLATEMHEKMMYGNMHMKVDHLFHKLKRKFHAGMDMEKCKADKFGNRTADVIHQHACKK
ncbi:MAG: hypothetical protein LIP05_04245 [Tannerellaceae bacterium]|nr:hypothetical protein [Tannerellaceae bacterium]